MKRVFILLVCLPALLFTTAQPITSFSTEHEQFLKELEHYVAASKAETNVQVMNDFQQMVKDGKISSAVLDQVIGTCNAMLTRMMAPNPHFCNYLRCVMNTLKGGKTDEQFDEWNKILTSVIKNQRKGDNNEFLRFIEFSNVFFEQNALSITLARTWKVDANSYRFLYENNKPRVSFSTTNLYGCIKGDTVSIHQTAGDYYPLETRWVGKSGRADWTRARLPADKVYCTFGNYSINISNVSYTIDTVNFYHSEYFEHPLRGKFIDKLVSGADSINLTYPRFESYEVGMTVKDIAPNVHYTGGFSLHGNRVLGSGTPEEKAELTFYARDGKTKVLSARSQSILIKKGEELGADKAEVSIYFGTDSIYHPQLNLIYKVQKREMRLLRGETGMGKAKFMDSYHNHEFQTDAIFWNLDSSVLNLKILSGVGQKPGVYESVNYFNKELLRQMQGYTSYDPLSILKKIYEKSGSREISAIEVARAIDPNLKEGEIKSLLYHLVEGGFIGYNEDLGIVTVKDKTVNYVLANAKKIDYDIIHLRSAPQSGNDYIDLQNSNIDLKGVYGVPITDTAHVYFLPKDKSISLQKDRNMEFDGTIIAGRMDLIGQRHKFLYAPFTVDLTKVDTMRINVPDSNKVDADGQPILKPLKSKVEGLVGMLEVDAPINKSGRTRLSQFPKLYSRENSYIYYDDPAIAKGAYNRKTFFFELQPFHLDSLNNFNPDIINWQGKLVSGGIFPDINDSVHLQSDASPGFKAETPEDGYDLYKGKGKYYGKFELNYSGLQGDGRITHSTAEFKAHDVHLYPDSMRATTDTFTIAKTFEGVQTPAVLGVSDMIFWRPVSDSMYISMMDKNQPFAMYDTGFTTFKGNLLLDAKELRGAGTLDWNEATLTSKNFAFHTMDLGADTSSLEIKTTGDKVTFKTPNVSAKVDFKTRIGDFVSNLKDVPTEFAYNQYTTGINQFKWYMDQKILDFRVPEGSAGEYFTATRRDQKGLKFIGRRATYNLITSLLRVEQVPEIRVADASVIPDSGILVIEEQAKMHQLRNAVIIADTIHKSHRFENAVVDIFSKEELQATGDYNYTTKGIKEVINFGGITCKKESEGKHGKQHDVSRLTAKSNIEEKQNFVIYPDVKFNGEVNIASVSPLINFKGFAKIDFKNPRAATSDFFIDQPVNRDTLGLRFSDSTKNSNGNLLSAGIFLNPNPEAPSLYSTLLMPKQGNNDIILFNASGIVTQLSNGDYLFGDERKIIGHSNWGNILRYDDKRGNVKAEGNFNLGLNFGLIKNAVAGTAEVKLDTIKYKFNFTGGIDVQLPDKLQERFEFYMANDNASQPDINYEKEQQKKPFYELSDEKDDKKMLDDFEKTSTFSKRPRDLDHNILFTDVNFVFDPDDITLRSVSKLGLVMVGKKAINKKIDGYIEFQYKQGGDACTIYLQNATKDWFYFEYRAGILSILSSYDDVNKIVTTTTPDKRKVKGDKGRFYLFTLASSLNKEDFVAYMKDKSTGVIRPRPAPHIEIPVFDTIPLVDSTMQPVKQERNKRRKAGDEAEQMQMDNQNVLSPPPPDRQKPRKKPKKEVVDENEEQQQPDQQQQEEQKQINEIEQLKMKGENILSGPPPDRLKPKEVPKTDTVSAKPQISSPIQDVPKTDTVSPKPQILGAKPEAPKLDSVVPKNEVKPTLPTPVDIPKADTVVQKPQIPTPKPDIPKMDSVALKTGIKSQIPNPKTDLPKADTVSVNPQIPSPKPDAQKADTASAKTLIPGPKPDIRNMDTISSKPEIPNIKSDVPKADTLNAKPQIPGPKPDIQKADTVGIKPEIPKPNPDMPKTDTVVQKPPIPNLKPDVLKADSIISKPDAPKVDSLPH